MSQVIQAIDDFQKSANGRNGVTFNASEGSFDFNFVYKPPVTIDKLLSLSEEICKTRKYTTGNDSLMFRDDGKVVMTINMDVKGIIRQKSSIAGFSISRNYEKSKELADYMLELLKPEK